MSGKYKTSGKSTQMSCIWGHCEWLTPLIFVGEWVATTRRVESRFKCILFLWRSFFWGMGSWFKVTDVRGWIRKDSFSFLSIKKYESCLSELRVNNEWRLQDEWKVNDLNVLYFFEKFLWGHCDWLPAYLSVNFIQWWGRCDWCCSYLSTCCCTQCNFDVDTLGKTVRFINQNYSVVWVKYFKFRSRSTCRHCDWIIKTFSLDMLPHPT